MTNSFGDMFPALFMCVCCFVIIVPFTVLLVFLLIKTRNQSWSGVILEKVHNKLEDSEGRLMDNYYFVVKMDGGGRNRNIGVTLHLYQQAKEGDKIRKGKGQLIPELVK